jgi:hypothetical protein
MATSEGDAAPRPARPFRAFVSYCHADAAFAARLQRRLEGYRLPKRLADRVAPLPGQAHGRIGPVFRDRADLPAAEDLSAAVREAIARSSALIVVASPEAARSHWVEREIELFRELHRGSPILVALARGELADALPESLRAGGVEPLAADFRREGGGKRLAFLKIVAALLGLPLDALVQRDAQRQVRRVTAVTLGAVVLVVIMALLLVMALRAREDAERQRAGAEGLVEFMLTDLREKLGGVGRLDVMEDVNKRAMAYYIAQGRLPDKSLQLRASVLHLMGEDFVSRGDFNNAFEKYSEANALTIDALARRPGDADAIYMQAQSDFYLGEIAQRRNDRATATLFWRRYRDRAGSLAKIERESARSLLELAFADGDLCQLSLQDNYDLNDAVTQCRNSVRFADAAVHKSGGEPKFVVALANRLGWLARVQIAMGEPRAALHSRESEAALLDRLLALDPQNVRYGVRRTWPDIGKADAWLALGQPAKAAEVLMASIARHRAALDKDRNVEAVIETEFRLQLFLARAQRKMGANFTQSMTRAGQLHALLAAKGQESAYRARGIRAGIWLHEGDGK